MTHELDRSVMADPRCSRPVVAALTDQPCRGVEPDPAAWPALVARHGTRVVFTAADTGPLPLGDLARPGALA